MRALPSPPVIAGTLSGFIVGVFVTLIALGVLAHSDASTKVIVTAPPAANIPDPQMYQRVKSIAIRQLGPSASTSKLPRFVSLKLVPAPKAVPAPPEGLPEFRTVILTFRLYDHPLGRPWRLRAAKADIFAVAKALYQTSLPVYDLHMIGTFPLNSGKTTREQTALDVLLPHDVAATIPWKRWSRKQEGALWNKLSYKHVDPRFA